MNTNTRSLRQIVLYNQPCNQSYRSHAICGYMPSWNHILILMHTWTYTRNEKVHFSLRSNIDKKKLGTCLLHAIDIAVVFKCPCHLKSQYLIQIESQIFVVVNIFCSLYSTCQQWDGRAFCSLSLKGHTNSSAAIENNFLRLSINLTHIYSIVCNPRTPGQNTYHKQTSSCSIRLHQYNTLLLCSSRDNEKESYSCPYDKQERIFWMTFTIFALLSWSTELSVLFVYELEFSSAVVPVSPPRGRTILGLLSGYGRIRRGTNFRHSHAHKWARPIVLSLKIAKYINTAHNRYR